MATVKTTGAGETLRILTKTSDGVQRVSCSCCDTACCPYPAAQLGIGYTQDDLPETITFNPNFGGGRPGATLQTATRSGTTYTTPVYSYVVLGQTITATSSVGIGLEGIDDVVWGVLQEGLDPTNSNSCLFRVGDTSLDDVEWRDDFDDIYQVSGPVSGTVTRESLCVWSGTGLTLSNFGYQWKVNGRNKSGNQNTPVGSYADGYSVAL